MDTPFVYGRIAENKNFTDREEEIYKIKEEYSKKTGKIYDKELANYSKLQNKINQD